MWLGDNGKRRKKSRKTKAGRRRSMRIEALEVRLTLHEEHDTGVEGERWMDHVFDDNDILNATAANPPIISAIAAAAVVDPALIGQWNPLQDWPIEYINTVMLPTGKVLGYDRTLNMRIWDPVTNTFTEPANPGFNFFCTGTAQLADGSILMTGGAVVDTVGLPYAAIYNPFTDTWTQLGNMNAGRWYPSTTTLANGDALVLSGDTNGNVTNPLPQVYDSQTGEWRDLTGAVQTLPFYPRTFSAPNGDAFIAGPQQFTEYLDTSGIGEIIPVGNRVEPWRDFGSAVMYAPGKILYVGGGTPASTSAEVIDLNDPNPVWRAVGSMEFARRNCNATLLPNGEVLVIGGNTGSGTYDGDQILAAEIWDPVTETFRTVADMDDIRWYHSVALLLPDGNVLSTSGDLHLTGQTYSPPYLFQGARPTITQAPGAVQYGDTFFVGTPDAATITSARWVRLGSATHAQDWDQYMSEATFTQTPGGLMVTAPPVPDASPPGYYYLFIQKGNVPSVAKIIRVSNELPEVSITGNSFTEGANGTTTNAVFTLTLAQSSAKPVTVVYDTADDTAKAGLDYMATHGTVTFAPYTTTQTVTVPILGDGIVELNELFTVNLSAPTGAVLDIAGAQGLIREFTALPALNIKGTTIKGTVVTEGDAGTSNAGFIVTLSRASTTPVTVAYTTVNGTATAAKDYIATTGILTFAPGVTQMPILVPIVGDTNDDFNNTFSVKLSAPVGATLETAETPALIYNNDAPPQASLMGNAVVNEPAPGATATLLITATLSQASGKPVTVSWTTAGDTTGKPGKNYVDQVGQIVFPAGVTTQTFAVTVLNDGVKTPNRTFSIQMLSEVVNANYGNRYTGVTIINTDTVPSISLANATLTEGNTGTGNMVFTATLSAPIATPVTVAYATSAGTATVTTDYTQAAGVITFAPGTTTQTITVVVRGDTTVESNETFNLTLSNPVGATLLSGAAVGTIVDNDGAAKPAAPTGLTAVAGYASVALSWNAVGGATTYRIYRGTAPNGEGTTPVGTGVVGTTFTDTGLVNGQAYYYRVTAVNALEGTRSTEVEIIPTSYNFGNGFQGRSLDPTVAGADGDSALLSLNGINVENVRLYGATLQLTDGGTNQTDSAFTKLPVNITRFTTQFTFEQLPSYLYTDALADGMTFTIQGMGPDAMGVSGGGLGYLQIEDSVAIKFDLYDNDGEGFNSTGLYTDGESPEGPDGSIDLTGTGIDLHSNHPFLVNMTYDGVTLVVKITDTVTLATATQTYTVDIPAIVGGNLAYVGFTGSTGGLTAVQKINSWVFTPAPAPPTALQAAIVGGQTNLSWTNHDPNATGVVIERKTGAGAYAVIATTATATANTYADTTVVPGTTYTYRVRATAGGGSTSTASNEVTITADATAPVLNFPNGFAGAAAQFTLNGATAGIVGTHLQLTDGGDTEAASIFATNPVNVTHFNTKFDIQMTPGTATMADGMTFTIQGAGADEVGVSGGGLGYFHILKSVAIKFDLFDNSGEGYNSTGLFINGVSPEGAANSIDLTGTGLDLRLGHPLTVQIAYDGAVLVVTITDSVTLATATQTYALDIPAIVGDDVAFVGFTGGTGGLTAVQSVLNWTYSVAATQPTLAAPTGLQVTSNTATAVALSWVNSAGSTAVVIERKTGAAGTYAVIGTTTTAAANTFIDNTVAANTTYVYRVQATSTTALPSAYSAELTVTTPQVTLAAPTGLQVTSNTATAVALSWVNSAGSTAVVIERKTGAAGTYAVIGTTTTAAANTFTDNTVAANTTYVYRVKATSATALPSAYSAELTVTTPQVTLAAPTGLQVTSNTATSVVLSWVNSAGSTAVVIERKTGAAGTYAVIGTTTTAAANTFTDNTVAANTTYVYRVKATSATALPSAYSAELTVTTPQVTLAAPTGLQVTSNTATSVALSWVNSASSTAVVIERKTGAAGTYAVIGTTTTAAANTFIDNTVAANTTYVYRVKATSATALPSAYSAELTVTTPQVTLAAPTGLQVTSNTATAVALSWVNSAGSTAVVIERKTGAAGTYAVIGTTTTAAANTFIDNTVAANTTYSYRVQATSATALPSAYSNVVTLTTPQLTTLAAPTGLQVTSNTAAAVSLSWVNSAGSTAVRIERRTGTGAYALIATTTTAAANTYTDTTVAPNTTYSYRVQATSATALPSAYSNVVTLTTPQVTLAAPTNLQVTSTAANSVGLSWVNSVGSTAVRIERRTGTGAYALIATTTTAAANTFTDTTAAANTTYSYRVQATGSPALPSAYSNVVTVTTLVAPVINYPTGFAGAGSAFSFNGGPAALASGALRVTNGGATTAGSVFFKTAVQVGAFNTQFNIQILPGTATLADGMTFTIQGNAVTALGGTGGALGYAGIGKSVAVKFDVFSNAGEGNSSTGLYTNGPQPNAVGSINLLPAIDLRSGHLFKVVMNYDGTTLQVTITDTVTLAAATQSYTVNIPAIVGKSTAFVGFTGATGGLTAVQTVKNWVFSEQSATAAPAALAAGSTSSSSSSAKSATGSTSGTATASANGSGTTTSSSATVGNGTTVLMEDPKSTKKKK